MSRKIDVKQRFAAVGLLGVLVLTLVYLYGGILGESVTKRPIRVTVALAETGGLFDGSGVSYRGVRVGRVDSIGLDGNGVSVRVSIAPDTRIPAGSEATVRTLSPAGEQYLDFKPSSGSGPFLHTGSAVTASHTSTPVSVASTLTAVDRLMNEVDDKNLTTVLDELHAAFAQPADLGRVVDSGSRVLRTLDENWPATQRVARNGRTVLQTAVDSSDDFKKFASSAKDLAAALKAYDPKIRSILDVAPAQLEQVRLFTSVLGLKLPTVLRDLDSLTQILAARDPHLRALLKAWPSSIDRLASTIKDGHLRAAMLVSPGEVCSYGVAEKSPLTATGGPAATDRSCGVAFNGGQRSAQHVPPVTR